MYKVFPRESEVAQGVPGRLRPRIILTFQHYKGGSSSAKRTGRLYPRRNSWYSLSEAESTPGHMVLSGVPRKKSPVTPPGIDPGTSRLIAQCLNHYATPGPGVFLLQPDYIKLKKKACILTQLNCNNVRRMPCNDTRLRDENNPSFPIHI